VPEDKNGARRRLRKDRYEPLQVLGKRREAAIGPCGFEKEDSWRVGSAGQID
jgi:hypothetical protein